MASISAPTRSLLFTHSTKHFSGHHSSLKQEVEMPFKQEVETPLKQEVERVREIAKVLLAARG